MAVYGGYTCKEEVNLGTRLIHLRNRSEFSFHVAFGRIPNVLETNQGLSAGICDRGGTWGHVQWQANCRKMNIKPIFGVELAVVPDMDKRAKEGKNYMAFIAKNKEGLKEIYELVTIATEKFYYEPRLDYSVIEEVSDDVIMLSGSNPIWDKLPNNRSNLYVDLSPASQPTAKSQADKKGLAVVASGDNSYCLPSDREAYEMVMGRAAEARATPQHIISEWEWGIFWDEEEALTNTQLIADMCDVELPVAEMVHPKQTKTLRQMCEEAAPRRGVDLSNPVYRARLERELKLIEDKDFADYFFVVADLCQFAKKHMLVGPARGSSCGSIVCFLIEITEIDPIPYNLLFERFIDINRLDYPDIDIDFPDDKRGMIFDYLSEKYGNENVARLGTVSRFKAKSAITDVSRALRIPSWDVNDLKAAIVDRTMGDARSNFCILDTFKDLDIGKKTLAKYPELSVSADIEGHARHTGIHAAAIIITNNPINWHCSVDTQTGAAQIDKYDAETVNLLKIDVLGLRTLSVIQDTLDQVGWSSEKLRTYPTDDKRAFDLLNSGNFAGIFQFEGYTLQSLCGQARVDYFEDIAALTALARPGPLHSGGATEYLKRRMGQNEVTHLHELVEPITKVTYGVVVYQEQVMRIAREIGDLSWEDVSSLRKAMSKSMGRNFFDTFYQRFRVGAEKNGIDEEKAKEIWDNINTMGSWAFNRSHAVAYGLISYWCCVLKSQHPLEFAVSCLRNAKDETQSIKVLRELTKENFNYVPFHKEKSQLNWSVQDGVVVGGLLGVKGIGAKTAEDIIKRREEGRALTARQDKLLDTGKTPYDMVFECRQRWGHIIDSPTEYGINSRITQLIDIKIESVGEFVFIARLVEKNLRDHNEAMGIERRGGKRMSGQTLFLNATVEDDTSTIVCTVDRFKYERLGLPIVEEGKTGDWYIFKGFMRAGFRKIYLKRWKKLTGNDDYENKMGCKKGS